MEMPHFLHLPPFRWFVLLPIGTGWLLAAAARRF
jgi:hypothetical protein